MATALDLERVEERLSAARTLYWAGRPGASLRRLRTLRERLTQQPAEQPVRRAQARVLLSMAGPHLEVTGDLDGALALLEDARELARIAEAPDVGFTVAAQRALLLLRSGRTDAALDAFDQAAADLRHASPRDGAILLLNRGALHLENAALDRAAEDFERCRHLAEASADDELVRMARHNQGYVDFLSGRLPRALAAFEEAERLLDGAQPHPTGLLDRARVLREAGLGQDADAILARAGELQRRERLFQDLGETELARAECALVDGDPLRARTFAESARRRFARRGNQRWERKAELLVLDADRRLTERPGAERAALIGVADRARRLAQLSRAENRRDLARAAELLGVECALCAGERPGAPLRVRSTDPLPLRLQVRQLRALAARNAGRPDRAAREVRRGLADLGSYQNRFGSLDLRTASAVHGVPLARLGLDIAVSTGRPSAVFAAVEQARAVSTRLASVRPPSDPRTADLLATLRRTEEDARALVGDPAAADRLTSLRTGAAELQREIRARAWQLEAYDEAVRSSARLSSVRAALQGRAFVTYARQRDRWIAVVCAGRRTQLVDIADVSEVDGLVRRVRADLDAEAMPHLPAVLAEAVRGSLDAALHRLDDLLLEPLRVTDRDLVVCGSGPLLVLPWSLLPSRAGNSLVVTPSATTWLRGESRSRPAALAVASIGGPGLHRAADEARGVAAAWAGVARESRTLTGAAATARATVRALGSADVVHVAAHGTHRQDSPLFSCLRLVDGPAYAYELDAPELDVPELNAQELDAHELDAQELDAQPRIAGAVSLSACEAGLATVRPGDEGLGFTSALLQLGAASVTAGVARVRDDVAEKVMVRVHHEMARGADSAAALATAQAGLAQEGVSMPFLTFGSAW